MLNYGILNIFYLYDDLTSIQYNTIQYLFSVYKYIIQLH